MIPLEAIREAARKLEGQVKKTPCLRSQQLTDATGVEVYLKYENQQLTGAYKERGALNKLLNLSEEDRARGVLAASAGNHAQGVAYHASRTGVQATIVMPETTPLIKVENTRRFGARVLLKGLDYDEAYEEAVRIRDEEGLTFIHPFDDPDVIAGQGTIGLELLEQVPDLQAVVVPIGGGGLISGIATAIKAQRPEVLVFGVQAARAPSMVRSLEKGEPTTVPAHRSLADGIQVKRPGSLTFEIVRRSVDAVRTVRENELSEAIIYLLEREKTLVEGAGAAGVAALVAGRFPELQGKKVATVLCGGNVDLPLLNLIIGRSLIRSGRLIRFSIKLPHRPGALAQLLQVLAEQDANVLEVEHHRTFAHTLFWEAEVTITLETRDNHHAEEIRAALEASDYHVKEFFWGERE